ncbi:hypothetical protein PMKS-003570 [Pichia membranifaciens]|uniref:Alpha-1,3/1,6-mannosyltransferase ALG2 n=1 Tax=Pichia membranifaciens TaxID=4926 RepID=A0A1Q2YKK9_9ASCO|nr:hypothetical protein PMKS-003570 [Pichia membranifaciens]
MVVVKTKQQQAKKPNIAFIHPDLGIGGAERLIVDAAMALQSMGNNITIYTSHCDKTHCFEEVKNGLLDVHVYGDFLPTNFRGKFNIVFAFLRQLYLKVVYPCVSTDETTFTPSSESLEIIDKLLGNNTYFLSINRFEKKKNIELAIQSFASYISNTSDDSQSVVISGGYDPRVSENVEYLNELKKICDKLNLSYKVYSPSSVSFFGQLNESEVPKVIFLTSISTDLKNALISKCDILLYTPTNEHFGIVPLEAMRMGKPVLADRSGGPLETIVDYSDDKNDYTGYTIDSDVSGWTRALEQVKRLPKEDLEKLSARTKKRVDDNFSLLALRNKLVKVIHQMMLKDSPHSWVTHFALPILFVAGVTFLYHSYF